MVAEVTNAGKAILMRVLTLAKNPIVKLLGLMIVVAASTNLVASSVPEPTPGRMTVVDNRGNILSGQKGEREMMLITPCFEYTRQIERHFRNRILGILIPVLGEQNVHAEVTADICFSPTEQNQGCLNTDISALCNDSLTGDADRTADVPPAANNPPTNRRVDPHVIQGDAIQDAAVDNANKPLIRHYEPDSRVSDALSFSRKLGRLSVAVVVDDKRVVTEAGTVRHVKRTAKEMDVLRQLVKAAIGFKEQRGDTLQVVNASFIPTESLAETPFWKPEKFWDTAIKVAAVILVLVLLLFVLRPMVARLSIPSLFQRIGEEETEIESRFVAQEGMEQQAMDDSRDSMQVSSTEQYQKLLNEAQRMVSEDPKRAAQVIKRWVAEDVE